MFLKSVLFSFLVALVISVDPNFLLEVEESVVNAHAKFYKNPQLFDILPQQLDDRVHLLATHEEHDLIRKYSALNRLTSPTILWDRENNYTDSSVEDLGFPTVVPAGYKTLAQINTAIQDIAKENPSIARMEDFAKEYGPGATYEGRPIWGLKISDNVNQDEDEPNILWVSEDHAREICTPEISLDLANTLVSGYGRVQWITELIQNTQVWILPLVNPDGYNYVFNTYNMWRKNRFPNGGNVYGVDLNRNFELGWSGSGGGSTNPNSDTYKGTAPQSENESKTIQGMMEKFNFMKAMDVHQSGREVLYGYRAASMNSGLETYLRERATALAAPSGYKIRKPSADGEHIQYQNMKTTMYSFLIELATSGFQPVYSQCTSVRNSLRPSVQHFLTFPASVMGHVKDSASSAPITGATITTPSLPFMSGETRKSGPKWGNYHLFLRAGSHSVTFAAPGYASRTISVTTNYSQTQQVEVTLVKN